VNGATFVAWVKASEVFAVIKAGNVMLAVE
jgi:molybdopterin-binding protein